MIQREQDTLYHFCIRSFSEGRSLRHIFRQRHKSTNFLLKKFTVNSWSFTRSSLPAEMGGFAPEWVVLLWNQTPFMRLAMPISGILGGFAPEQMGGLDTHFWVVMLRSPKYAEEHYGTFEDGFSLDDDDEDDPIYDEEFISQYNEDVKNLPVFLKPLAQLSAKESDEFYLLFDCKSWSLDEIQVFKDEISAWNALREYVGDDIYCTWEEMDDDELSSWYEDLQDVLDEGEYDSIISIKFLEMKNDD